jgi:hypothetical protein
MSAGMSRDFSKEKKYKIFDGHKYYFYSIYAKQKSARDWAQLNVRMGRKFRIIKEGNYWALYCTRS